MNRESNRVAVVGARRKRQGTGEYVAREFARCGCEVRAIVGTTDETVKRACATLRERYEIECSGFLSLSALLEKEPVDMVAICSPPAAHWAQLEVAIQAGCHVFCEKPLWWTAELSSENAGSDVGERAQRLLQRCTEQGRYLAVNTQWPFTLEAFSRLHPEAALDKQPIEQFSMWLSPASSGPDMVVDSAPHLLSMLYALMGYGSLERIRAEYIDVPGVGDDASLQLSFVYKHARGASQVEFSLVRCPEPPRPAGYRINGFGVERHVELPGYLISFISDGRRVCVTDPLAAAVAAFVRSVQTGCQPDSTSVVDGMVQLQQLVAAAELRKSG
jgi:predicted dehydrogenase